MSRINEHLIPEHQQAVRDRPATVDVCGRPTLAQQPCRQKPQFGPACRYHLTAEEREQLDHDIQAYQDRIAEIESRIYDTIPACWEWPLPEGEVGTDSYAQHERLISWQNYRCAICGGQTYDMVMDHDHVTNLVRGYLCRSCNTREGFGGGPIFDRYRDRHPTVILGVKINHFGYPSSPVNPPLPLENDPSLRVGAALAGKPPPDEMMAIKWVVVALQRMAGEIEAEAQDVAQAVALLQGKAEHVIAKYDLGEWAATL
ncbi:MULTISPECIES: endonuclease domain-containing protein [Streptosporangiaceae]|uniref:endonuclease domain-containing protein n=1 Tax=Streptosporangiaceae TaxID=2004 RepID=UPI00340E8412